MEERSLRVYNSERTFFNKIANGLTKMLIPTKIGINGFLITIKRTNILKAYEEVKKKVIEMGYYEKEEDVLSYAVFEQVAENFFKWREAQKDGVDRDLAKGNVYPV